MQQGINMSGLFISFALLGYIAHGGEKLRFSADDDTIVVRFFVDDELAHEL
jgi:hypothetical protein